MNEIKFMLKGVYLMLYLELIVSISDDLYFRAIFVSVGLILFLYINHLNE